jgi:hypothetical protein
MIRFITKRLGGLKCLMNLLIPVLIGLSVLSDVTKVAAEVLPYVTSVVCGPPERVYNLMFASAFFEDFKREVQKLQGKSLFPLPSYMGQVTDSVNRHSDTELGGCAAMPSTRAASHGTCLLSSF